jgi:hypothetical protein
LLLRLGVLSHRSVKRHSEKRGASFLLIDLHNSPRFSPRQFCCESSCDLIDLSLVNPRRQFGRNGVHPSRDFAKPEWIKNQTGGARSACPPEPQGFLEGAGGVVTAPERSSRVGLEATTRVTRGSAESELNGNRPGGARSVVPAPVRSWCHVGPNRVGPSRILLDRDEQNIQQTAIVAGKKISNSSSGSRGHQSRNRNFCDRMLAVPETDLLQARHPREHHSRMAIGRFLACGSLSCDA